MWEFIADKILAGAIDWALGLPWFIWAIPAAILIGLAWKFYKIAGWQGIAGALLLILTVGAYRQGWNDSARRRGANSFDKKVEDIDKPRVRTIQDTLGGIFQRNKRKKRRYNSETNTWETVDGTRN